MKKQSKQEETDFLVNLSDMAKEEFNSVRHKKRLKGLRGKKKLMVTSLMQKFGIVTAACKEIGIDRTTHYYWMKTDPVYAKACEDANLVLKDFGEQALVAIMIEKNPQAIIYFNKTKNRDRGYGEHIVTEEVGESNLKNVNEELSKLKDLTPEQEEIIRKVLW